MMDAIHFAIARSTFMPLRDQKRVQTAIDYVNDHLSGSLTVAEVASKVHLSEFHFHRIFKAMTNEPFNQYVRRKRLEKAYHNLMAAIPPSISAVSESCGFSSTANFSKAFRAYFGFSASDHRKAATGINSKNGKLFSKHGKEISPARLYNGSLSALQINEITQQIPRIEVITLEETHYCCIASRKGYDFDAIQTAWQELFHWLAQHDIKNECGKSIAFCWDNKWLVPEEMCRYECGYQIDDIAWAQKAGISTRILPGGRYLAIEFQGQLSKSEQFYLWVFSEYLPQSRLVPVHQYVVERYYRVDHERDILHVEVLLEVN